MYLTSEPQCMHAQEAHRTRMLYEHHCFKHTDTHPRTQPHPHTLTHTTQVTTRGEPVVELDSVHRKPYEPLLIARRPLDSTARETNTGGKKANDTHADIGESGGVASVALKLTNESSMGGKGPSAHSCGDRAKTDAREPREIVGEESNVEGDGDKEGVGEGCVAVPIPDAQVIVSVPSRSHSRKPPLNGT